MFKFKYLFFPFEEIKAKEYQESLKEGGIKEPRPFRDLTEEEKAELKSSFRFSLQIRSSFWWIILASLVADAVFIYATLRFFISGSGNIFYGIFSGSLFLILTIFSDCFLERSL